MKLQLAQRSSVGICLCLSLLGVFECVQCVHTCLYVHGAFKWKLKIPCRSRGLILLAYPFLYLGNMQQAFLPSELVVRSLYPTSILFCLFVFSPPHTNVSF